MSKEARGVKRSAKSARLSAPRSKSSRAKADGESKVCSRFHHAVELIGRRWTGAIISVIERLEKWAERWVKV